MARIQVGPPITGATTRFFIGKGVTLTLADEVTGTVSITGGGKTKTTQTSQRLAEATATTMVGGTEYGDISITIEVDATGEEAERLDGLFEEGKEISYALHTPSEFYNKQRKCVITGIGDPDYTVEDVMSIELTVKPNNNGTAFTLPES